MSHPTYYEHLIALAWIWACLGAIVAACVGAAVWPWLKAGVGRLRARGGERGGLGRGRAERWTP